METGFGKTLLEVRPLVLSLPMRDGNTVQNQERAVAEEF